jgi:general secretion pathway protein D
VSGEVAQFQVGGEIPITTTFAPTTGAVFPGVFNAVSFVPIGVMVCARPLVGDADSITLDLIPQVIQPDPALTAEIRRSSGVNPPTTALESRTLSTSTTLMDGQSLLIAGLLSRKADRLDNGNSLLGQIPFVRYLFSSYSDSEEQRDLVLLVEPTIVRSPAAGASAWSYPGTAEITMSGIADAEARGRVGPPVR